MNTISRQKSIMQAALDCLKEIEFVETKLFGIDESYKRAKIEKLRERYADLLADLLQTMPLKFLGPQMPEPLSWGNDFMGYNLDK